MVGFYIQQLHDIFLEKWHFFLHTKKKKKCYINVFTDSFLPTDALRFKTSLSKPTCANTFRHVLGAFQEEATTRVLRVYYKLLTFIGHLLHAMNYPKSTSCVHDLK